MGGRAACGLRLNSIMQALDPDRKTRPASSASYSSMYVWIPYVSVSSFTVAIIIYPGKLNETRVCLAIKKAPKPSLTLLMDTTLSYRGK